MKNAYLPKISILLQFGGEILPLLCPGDSIQILLFLSQKIINNLVPRAFSLHPKAREKALGTRLNVR